MKRFFRSRFLRALLPACASLVGCGGGGGGDPGTASYVAARSASFSPTTARDRATGSQDVALHWTYVVNDDQPISATLDGTTVTMTPGRLEVTIDPGALQRRGSLQATLAARSGGVGYTGNLSTTVGEDLALGGGRTLIRSQSVDSALSLAGGGESATLKLASTVGAFTPAYEWFPDRETLDQLPVGSVQTISSNGILNLRVDITDSAPIVASNRPVTATDRWTVLEKLPTMTVRGRTYSNVLRLGRQTQLPDLSGTLTNVTMNYWMARGVGMIRGQGNFGVLNVDDVVYELIDTNLAQQ